jgi:hypothetical protein
LRIQEKPLRYGEGGRGFAMVTLPENTERAPIVALLNAGLLHRAEPYRLNVLIARRLAQVGYVCVRVDLSGKGETPPREGLTNRDSVSLDWKYLSEAVVRQLGPRPFVILGLCSGADNGIKLAAVDTKIRGLVLLDPVSPRDAGFMRRRLIASATNWRKWARLPFSLAARIRQRGTKEANLGLRDLPAREDLDGCIANLMKHDGRILMVFTGHATSNYNQAGQFARVMAVPGLNAICDEHFWPNTEHLYPVADHRERLIQVVGEWASKHLNHFRSQQSSWLGH